MRYGPFNRPNQPDGRYVTAVVRVVSGLSILVLMLICALCLGQGCATTSGVVTPKPITRSAPSPAGLFALSSPLPAATEKGHQPPDGEDFQP